MERPAAQERASRPTVDGASDAGLRLRTAREERGWSRRQLSELTGVSESAIANIEHGRTGAHKPTREALARALDLREEDLRGVRDDFSTWLRQERLGVGWSQERLAEEAGVVQSYIGQLERGLAIAHPRTADRIVEVLATRRQRDARRLYEAQAHPRLRAVADALGVSEETARRDVIRAGGAIVPLAGRKLPTVTRRKMTAALRREYRTGKGRGKKLIARHGPDVRQKWGRVWGGNTPPKHGGRRGRQPGYTEEQEEQVKALLTRYEEGDLSLGQIATKVGCTKSQVDYIKRAKASK
jgi:transcriptional regulator with XRE-family HTH domain